MGYTTYKWDQKKSCLVPRPDLDTFNDVDDPVDEAFLLSIGYKPVSLPLTHDGTEVKRQVCFYDPEEPRAPIYGPDSMLNYAIPETVQKSMLDTHEIVSLLMSGSLVSASSLEKSLYNFDLTSLEGIKNTIQALPIMELQIVQQIAQSIWPGLDTLSIDPTDLKQQITGYLLDVLASANVSDD